MTRLATYPPPTQERDRTDPPQFHALNPNQRAFVIAFVANGGNGAAAGREAGYKDAAHSAMRLLRDNRIKAAVYAELQESLHGGAVEAVRTLRDIASKPTHMNAVKAATAILDRTGFAVVQQIKAEVTVKSGDDKIREIAEAARILGRPLHAVFGTITDLERADVLRVLGPGVLDAEFEEVPT